LGQTLPSFAVAQSAQNVHSNVQMRASVDSFGRSRLQHSQLGRSASTLSREPSRNADARAVPHRLLRPLHRRARSR
jgi:hypothetical protein